MNFHILTLFPEMVENALNTSILKRAADAGIISINAINIRDYSTDKHKKVDDYPYGGGAGMLMQAQPVFDAYEDLCKAIKKRKKSRAKKLKVRVLYMTPQGRTFDQKYAEELALEEDLIFLCGHYEGIDERVIEEIVTDEVSLGDFVLTGGELPAMVMVDCISRLIPGVLGSDESASDESFSDGLLEYPQYTRPEVWQGKSVPDVLLSGNHKEIEKWRMEMSLKRTKERRPDLYESIKEELDEFKAENPKKFKKNRSEAEEVLKMREIKNAKKEE
ncbi:MAG: tRNA (guanosine(37)-N1)-methyltransferase TrmD [Lachnospiraceae bacterium]|nr:tRNA (guanosine(37)-N1)-methyltransferase TrmD [Lachnospiraceae bacterium]